MNRNFICLFLSFAGIISVSAQIKLTYDTLLNKQLIESDFIHNPLPLDIENSLQSKYARKKIESNTSLEEIAKGGQWKSFGTEPVNGKVSLQFNGRVKWSFPMNTGQRAYGSKSDPDYAIYGKSSLCYKSKPINLERYNRIAFSIYPDCSGKRIVNINLYFTYANQQIKKEYFPLSGTAHLFNLENKKWNRCYFEMTDIQRTDVSSVCFEVSLNGKDMTTGDSSVFYIDSIGFEIIKKPEKIKGWNIEKDKIIYSMSGYEENSSKTAITDLDHYKNSKFQLIDKEKENVLFEGNVQPTHTSLGNYSILDFSAFNVEGEYRIKLGNLETMPFRIGKNIWDSSLWKVTNFLFCQRCGCEVPKIHSVCHTDLFSQHNGKAIPYSGGWHDAGDLSQQTLQTGDVTFSLMEAYNKLKDKNILLAKRLLEEAKWGLSFLLKNRYGDGYRASSMGLLIWQDGIINTLDDISTVRVKNTAYDNFLYSAYEGYAAMTIDDDPMLIDYLKKIAEEDFSFAIEKFREKGFDHFEEMYEHTYNTSESQYMATISWASSILYKMTGKRYYADIAKKYIRYTLDCQQTANTLEGENINGFFYRDKSKTSIVHYVHQSREQIYMLALFMLCETQKEDADFSLWIQSARLYGNYIKAMMPYMKPYGMIPSGVYKTEEYKDSINFYKLHLLPPANAKDIYAKQIRKGVKLNEKYYLRRFPVCFSIFNGNNAVLLSMGKSAVVCGKLIHDEDLVQLGREQLYWIVGKNPFGQSLLYGEGHDYPQMDSFTSGEMTGEMPVGIRSWGDDDIPYWPQINNACYKEVWTTSAGKWISLVSEYE